MAPERLTRKPTARPILTSDDGEAYSQLVGDLLRQEAVAAVEHARKLREAARPDAPIGRMALHAFVKQRVLTSIGPMRTAQAEWATSPTLDRVLEQILSSKGL